MSKEDIRKKFAKNLKAIRLLANLSRSEAAQKIGVSYVYYCQMEDETKDKSVSNEILSRIADTFEIEVYMLYK